MWRLIKNKKTIISRYNFPVNMNKTWIWAEKILENINSMKILIKILSILKQNQMLFKRWKKNSQEIIKDKKKFY